MPIIKVEMFSGRSKEQKRKLSKLLTEAFVTATGSKAAGVQIIYTDVDKDNWSVGGELCSDRDGTA